MWEEPGTAHCFERLASFSRLIMFDRRGTGLSDPVSAPPTLEQQMDDLNAVLGAVGSERIALFGASDLGLSALFAATYPDRVTALVLSGVAADGAQDDLPGQAASCSSTRSRTAGATATLIALFAPSQADNRAFARVVGAAAALGGQPRNGAPAAGDDHPDRPAGGPADDPRADAGDPHAAATGSCRSSCGREVAASIPGARFIAYDGDDAYAWARLAGARGHRGVPHRPARRAAQSTGCWRPSCSPTSSAPPSAPSQLGDGRLAGAARRAQPNRARRAGGAGGGPRSRRSATASWPRSTARRGRSAAPRRSSTRCASWAC